MLNLVEGEQPSSESPTAPFRRWRFITPRPSSCPPLSARTPSVRLRRRAAHGHDESLCPEERSRPCLIPGLTSVSAARSLVSYGPGMFGPEPELRRLDAIRASLLRPALHGPRSRLRHRHGCGAQRGLDHLKQRMLLFGVVVYAAGRLGQEPVRARDTSTRLRRTAAGRRRRSFRFGRARHHLRAGARRTIRACVAVTARPGDKVVVPPGWAHCVINADPTTRMVFGAWCDRQYGFDYDGVRAHGGLAWFPLLDADNRVHWEPNPPYRHQS